MEFSVTKIVHLFIVKYFLQIHFQANECGKISDFGQ